MKKMTAFLSLLIALCLLCSPTFFAQSAAAEQESAVLDIESVELDDLSAQDSYILTENGESVLVVEHHNEVPGAKAAFGNVADNGYYTAEFCIPNATKKVFLTGLTRANVAEIEAAIIASYASGDDFELTDLGFIDTEKTGPEDDDDELCWAAAASNILTYTGWAAQAGFADEDAVFESLINNFENKGGNTYYGVEWFFDGTDKGYFDSDGNFPRVLNYPSSGGYLADYTFDNFTEYLDEFYPDNSAELRTLLNQLKSGSGVELGLNLYQNGRLSNGHAVTLWGFVTDTRYDEEDPEYYDSIFITDSDSDKDYDERRDAPDVMDLNALTLYQENGVVSYSFDLGSNYTAYFSDAVILKPYSADLPKETSSAATRNRRTTPDLTMDKIVLSDAAVAKTDPGKSNFDVGSNLYFRFFYTNQSDVYYSGDLSIKVKVTSSTGRVLVNTSLSLGTKTLDMQQGYSASSSSPLTKSLAAGVYTMTVEGNPDHAVSEAYYFNNTCTTTFSVGGAYLTGDVDDDDDVNTIDATLIMRKTAKFNVNLDDNAIIRGDINLDGDMDIVDATYIQRYLVEMTVPFDVNVRKRYS